MVMALNAFQKRLSKDAINTLGGSEKIFRERLLSRTICNVIVRLERLSDYGYLSLRYKCQNKERILKNTTDAMSSQDKLFFNIIIKMWYSAVLYFVNIENV